ncbi:MAG: bifunctional 2-polyprenyl-6-hydroxyphenol methylase/3-demethylubiquinol 3-O-methyltransferase UbiG [Arenicellales bacterium WSBS_2016_MAG_OTU3]
MTTVFNNYDTAELHKFAELASRWWDTNSEFKPLHAINPLRLNYIDERSNLHGKRVLDVGCGGGILSESMAQRGADVTGIDMGQAPLSVARLHAQSVNVTVDYQKITAEELAERVPASFDVVTCLEMLEHVPAPDKVIAACAKLVKPGGDVYFSTINRNPKAWLFAIVGAEYVLKLLPKGTHDYARLIKPSEMHADCRAAQLKVKDMVGLHYNPLSQKYWLAPGLDVNYMAHTMRPN